MGSEENWALDIPNRSATSARFTKPFQYRRDSINSSRCPAPQGNGAPSLAPEELSIDTLAVSPEDGGTHHVKLDHPILKRHSPPVNRRGPLRRLAARAEVAALILPSSLARSPALFTFSTHLIAARPERRDPLRMGVEMALYSR